MNDKKIQDLWRLFTRSRSKKRLRLRNLLAEHYLPLVKFHARRIKAAAPLYVELDDLIADGYLGLLDAIDKYRPARQVKFEIYSAPRIRGAILDKFRKNNWVPRLTRLHARRLLTEGSVTKLMREYHVGYPAMTRYVYPLILPVDMQILKAKQRRRYVAGGRKYRFQKGLIPWNRGLKGLDFPGSRATQFKKGCLRGNAARKYRSVGALSIRKDKCGRSFFFIKVSDSGPPAARFIPYARYLWLRQRGPIPAGQFIVHIDGNTLNNKLSNLRPTDRRGHFNIIKQRMSPEAEARRKRKAAQRNRAVCVNKRRSITLKATYAQKRQARTAAKVWECPACGAEYPAAPPPAHCAKCGGHSFARRRVTA